MKSLWCWRCQKVVPMLEETEYQELDKVYQHCIEQVKAFRKKHETSLDTTPVSTLFAPVREKYAELTGYEELDYDEIRRHRLALFGPPCSQCGKPIRTPNAKFCAACGSPRQ